MKFISSEADSTPYSEPQNIAPGDPRLHALAAMEVAHSLVEPYGQEHITTTTASFTCEVPIVYAGHRAMSRLETEIIAEQAPSSDIMRLRNVNFVSEPLQYSPRLPIDSRVTETYYLATAGNYRRLARLTSRAFKSNVQGSNSADDARATASAIAHVTSDLPEEFNLLEAAMNAIGAKDCVPTDLMNKILDYAMANGNISRKTEHHLSPNELLEPVPAYAREGVNAAELCTKIISKHTRPGQSLGDEIIDRKVELRFLGSGILNASAQGKFGIIPASANEGQGMEWLILDDPGNLPRAEIDFAWGDLGVKKLVAQTAQLKKLKDLVQSPVYESWVALAVIGRL